MPFATTHLSSYEKLIIFYKFILWLLNLSVLPFLLSSRVSFSAKWVSFTNSILGIRDDVCLVPSSFVNLTLRGWNPNNFFTRTKIKNSMFIGTIHIFKPILFNHFYSRIFRGKIYIELLINSECCSPYKVSSLL